MILPLGDYNLTETVNIPFNTFSSDDPSASVTVTNLAGTDVYVHKDGVEGTPTGITVSLNVGAVNGNHLAILDLTDTNDAGFYAVGARYQVRMEGVTIDGATVNAWIGAFSIGCTLRPTTAGRTFTVESDGVGHADVKEWAGTALASAISAANLAKLEDILNGTGGTGLTLNSLVINGTAAGGVVNIDNAGGPGIAINGSTLGVDIDGAAGSGVQVTGTTHGVEITASAGPGVEIDGTTFGIECDASAGPGVHIGGTTFGMQLTASAGPALSCVVTAGNSSGILAQGFGNDHGAIFTGGSTGHGFKIVGGANGNGLVCQGGTAIHADGENYGIQAEADQAGSRGMQASGVAYGFEITASAGPALSCVASAGNNSGIVATKAGTGYDIDADIHGTIDTVTTLTTKTGFSLANGSIVAATFAADAIAAAAIATGAFTADAFAANALVAATFAASSLNGKGDWNTTTPDAAGVVATALGNGTVILHTNYDAAKTAAQAGDQMDLVDAPNGTAITAIQSGLSTHNAAAVKTAIEAGGSSIAQILADTNELQTDWANDGRLDSLLDAIPTTAMRGTNSAALAATALSTVVWTGARAAVLTDWINGERLDLLLDDIKVVTDALTAATAAKIALSGSTIVSGAAAVGTLSTTQMTTNLTEATDDHYNGRIIIWTSGVLQNQATDITDYDGATKMLTYTATTEAPSADDSFVVV